MPKYQAPANVTAIGFPDGRRLECDKPGGVVEVEADASLDDITALIQHGFAPVVADAAAPATTSKKAASAAASDTATA